MNFTSYSQSGQDQFVHEVLAGAPGRFLDIGAGHWRDVSNTYGLEQARWTGVLVENSPAACADLRANRNAIVMEADATKVIWRQLGGMKFDYLSLDVDYVSCEVLMHVLLAGVEFRVATVEHNLYNYARDGYPTPESPRWMMRAMMGGAGYEMVCSDVMCGMAPFEDWWIRKGDPARAIAEKFRCSGKDGRSIMGLRQAT